MEKTTSKITCGFTFSHDMTYIVLILKNRPKAIEGLWNGPGGKVEEGESTQEAHAREMGEETGIHIPTEAWNFLRTVNPIDSKWGPIDCFWAIGDISKACTQTDEEVAIFDVSNLPSNMVQDAKESIEMILAL